MCQLSQAVSFESIGVTGCGIAEIQSFTTSKAADLVNLSLCSFLCQVVLLCKAVESRLSGKLGSIWVELESLELYINLSVLPKVVDSLLQSCLANIAIRACIITPINNLHLLFPFLFDFGCKISEIQRNFVYLHS